MKKSPCFHVWRKSLTYKLGQLTHARNLREVWAHQEAEAMTSTMACGCERTETPGPNGGTDVVIEHVWSCTATGRLPLDGAGARAAKKEIAARLAAPERNERPWPARKRT